MSIKSRIKHLIQHTRIVAIPQTIDSKNLLAGKTALIVGGSSGIGLSIAEEFMKNGCNVAIAGKSEHKINNALLKLGGGVLV